MVSFSLSHQKKNPTTGLLNPILKIIFSNPLRKHKIKFRANHILKATVTLLNTKFDGTTTPQQSLHRSTMDLHRKKLLPQKKKKRKEEQKKDKSERATCHYDSIFDSLPTPFSPFVKPKIPGETPKTTSQNLFLFKSLVTKKKKSLPLNFKSTSSPSASLCDCVWISFSEIPKWETS